MPDPIAADQADGWKSLGGRRWRKIESNPRIRLLVALRAGEPAECGPGEFGGELP